MLIHIMVQILPVTLTLKHLEYKSKNTTILHHILSGNDAVIYHIWEKRFSRSKDMEHTNILSKIQILVTTLTFKLQPKVFSLHWQNLNQHSKV